MADWFNVFASGHEFRSDAARALREDGFVVLPGLMPCGQVERLRRAYDAAAASAVADDVRVGSTTTRVNDFVNRGVEFDAVYVLPALLEACCHIIGRPFKLSSLHARTLRPDSPMSELHVDVRRDSKDWPLAGFILMIDGTPKSLCPIAEPATTARSSLAVRPARSSSTLALRPWQGTCWRSEAPRHDSSGPTMAPRDSCLALIDGRMSTGRRGTATPANVSGGPRRSLQGAFIPRGGRAGTDFSARMRPETLARLAPLARYVLAV